MPLPRLGIDELVEASVREAHRARSAQLSQVYADRDGARKEEIFTEYRFGGNQNYKVYFHPTKAAAVAQFKEWFHKKTGNEWDSRDEFKQLPDYYNFVELSTVDKDQIHRDLNTSRGGGGGGASSATAPCALPKETRALVELLFDDLLDWSNWFDAHRRLAPPPQAGGGRATSMPTPQLPRFSINRLGGVKQPGARRGWRAVSAAV